MGEADGFCVWGACILFCFRKGLDSPQMMHIYFSMPPSGLDSQETT